ncbi:S-protein homolog 1-like [Momordica charantia]|uniref:S-protein homolog n=1 Tax=Momordica charantia TaxID=3673 RepID=A0A6J1DPJ1_MOMCH|nr:S-protein homolog 1-like [Momordica charantia]
MVLLVFWVVLVVVRPGVVALHLPMPLDKWNIHVVNGLSNNATLFVHCKSKDDDLGYHHLIGRGDELQWTFRINFWKTTLYWCFMHKPNADVSFDSFWVEKTHIWLTYRCKDGICIWTAKDDGIYLRNIPNNDDELVHKWNTKL